MNNPVMAYDTLGTTSLFPRVKQKQLNKNSRCLTYKNSTQMHIILRDNAAIAVWYTSANVFNKHDDDTSKIK